MYTIQPASAQRTTSFTPFFRKFFPFIYNKSNAAVPGANPGNQAAALTAIQSVMSMYVWTIELKSGK